jgi:hypothetical protein
LERHKSPELILIMGLATSFPIVGTTIAGRLPMSDTHITTIREAVGVFHNADEMETAIEELEESGFDRAEISLLASQDAVREKLGHAYADAKSLEDSALAPRTAFVSTESVGDAEGAVLGGLMYVGALVAAGAVVASGGSFGALLAATVTGTASGGLIGGALAALVGKQHADSLQEQLDRGGLLVWVRTPTEADENRAVDILKRTKADDVHLHSIEA